MSTFTEKWLEVVERKNSVLCAGLDPAEFNMGRGEEGLSENISKSQWALNYISAIAPYCAAIKPNIQYWKGRFDMINLSDITKTAHQYDLLVIDDSKLADIGSTNDAGIYHAQSRNMDAITLACFAGNIKEASLQLKKRNLGGIHMCLMSNPEYEREKNKLVQISEKEDINYNEEDIKIFQENQYVKQYVQLAVESKKYDLDGIVIGAPSKKNHIQEEEIRKVKDYIGNFMLILLPGIGAQGGETDAIWKYFGKNNVIVNVGRDLMFPKGSQSLRKDHQERARYYQEMLNKLRTA